MSETILEWITLLLFFLLIAGAIIAEAQWLVRKGWAVSSRAIGFVMASDLLGLFLGSGVVFAAFFVMFMMVMGPAGRGGTSPEFAYWAVTAIAVILPIALLILSKRLFLVVFKLRSGKPAWLYSLVSSLAVILVVMVPPPLFFYLIATIWK